jgi:hypothetical protein
MEHLEPAKRSQLPASTGGSRNNRGVPAPTGRVGMPPDATMGNPARLVKIPRAPDGDETALRFPHRAPKGN